MSPVLDAQQRPETKRLGSSFFGSLLEEGAQREILILIAVPNSYLTQMINSMNERTKVIKKHLSCYIL